MDFQLYDWQNRCLNAWFRCHCRGIANVITGAGKTILALAAIKRLNQESSAPLKVKIIVPKNFMIRQWTSAILNLYEYLGIEREEIGCYSGNRKDSPDRKYMIYVINSARYSLARHIIDDINNGNSVLLIADECHHYGSEENRKIFDFIDFLKTKGVDLDGRYYSLGLSATPQNTYFNSVLVPALGREFFRYGLKEAIQSNTINSFTLFQVALSFTPQEQMDYDEVNEQLIHIMRQLTSLFPYLNDLDRNTYFQTLQHMTQDHTSSKVSSLALTLLKLMYERKQLISTSSVRLSCALQLVQLLDSHAKIIIFGEQISQTDQLFEQLQKLYPRQTGRYHSAMDQTARRRVLQEYHDGGLRILLCCKALDEGLDVPAANVGIILSSTNNQRQRLQRLGRILRKTDTIKDACLYYLYIGGTTEDQGFLESIPEHTPVLELSYSTEYPHFSNPPYDQLASHVYHHLANSNLDSAALAELKTCLASGQLRTDWLLDHETCELRMRKSESVHERNYWFCMSMMQKYRELQS